MGELEDAKSAYRRGLVALNTLREQAAENDEKQKKHVADQFAKTHSEMTVLRERVLVLETLMRVTREDTGAHTLAKVLGKEEALKEIKHDEKSERQLSVEKWKASAPILVAIITGAIALITSVVNVILHLVG